MKKQNCPLVFNYFFISVNESLYNRETTSRTVWNVIEELFEKNRLSQVVHQGMRSYFFSADTQEDMLGWVRALSQSALMEPDGTLNRYGAV